MARNKTTTVAAAAVRRPRRWRWMLAIFLGLLLGLATVFFLSRIYNPFGASLAHPLVLVPDDADFVVSIPDLASLAKGVRGKDFSRALAEHRGFQDFANHDAWARDMGLAQAVRDMFAALDKVEHGLLGSAGLSLEDAAGQAVVLAGYFPESASDALRYMVAFRPGSWKALAAVNVLRKDDFLYRWFVKDRLEGDPSVQKVEHFRDAVRIVTQDVDVFVTRIADAIVVSNDGRALGALQKQVDLKGIPDRPSTRFSNLMPGSSLEKGQVQVLMNKARGDQHLGITDTLLRQWGPKALELAESTLPRAGSGDVGAYLQVGVGLSLGIMAPPAPSRPEDLAPFYRPFPKDHLEQALSRVGGFFPSDAFGFLYVEADVGDLVNSFFQRFDPADREALDTWAKSVPELGSTEGLSNFLTQVCGPEVSIVFFRQPRETLRDKAAPGYALCSPLKDRDRLRSFLESQSRLLVATQAKESPIKDLVHRKFTSSIQLWEVVLREGALDDPRVEKPGIAIVEGHCLLTNFHPILERIVKVVAGEASPLTSHRGFMKAASYAPESLRLAALLDGAGVYPYMEQSKEGWASSQTGIMTPQEQIRFRNETTDRLVARGLTPGSVAFEDAMSDAFNRKQADRFRIERPALLQEIERKMGYFQGLFSGLGIFVEDRGLLVRLHLRLDHATP